MKTTAFMMTVGTLEYFAMLTADSLRWTAKGKKAAEVIETIKAYDQIDGRGFNYRAFSDAVKISSIVLYGPTTSFKQGKVA